MAIAVDRDFKGAAPTHRRRLPAALFIAAVLTVGAAASAQYASIVGVWRAVEGTPSSPSRSQPSASDVQTLTLTADGRYRREIVVEGGDGYTGAAGRFVDTGTYRFAPPSTFHYRRASYTLCTALACNPYPSPPPNAGTLSFQMDGRGRGQFLGLTWKKIQ